MKNINLLLQDALDVMEDLNIEVENIVSISWNNRLTGCWGQCKRKNEKYYNIELNTILNNDAVSWEDALNTVIHEVLHCHKDRFCHTGEWKRCAELINREYPIYHIERCTSIEEKGVANLITHTYKYEVHCLNCGFIDRYMREGKVVKLIRQNPHSCICGNCGASNFKLIIH